MYILKKSWCNILIKWHNHNTSDQNIQSLEITMMSFIFIIFSDLRSKVIAFITVTLFLTRLYICWSIPMAQCPPPSILSTGLWSSCYFCINKLPYLITFQVLNLILRISLHLLTLSQPDFQWEHCFLCSILLTGSVISQTLRSHHGPRDGHTPCSKPQFLHPFWQLSTSPKTCSSQSQF